MLARKSAVTGQTKMTHQMRNPSPTESFSPQMELKTPIEEKKYKQSTTTKLTPITYCTVVTVVLGGA